MFPSIGVILVAGSGIAWLLADLVFIGTNGVSSYIAYEFLGAMLITFALGILGRHAPRPLIIASFVFFSFFLLYPLRLRFTPSNNRTVIGGATAMATTMMTMIMVAVASTDTTFGDGTTQHGFRYSIGLGCCDPSGLSGY